MPHRGEDVRVGAARGDLRWKSATESIGKAVFNLGGNAISGSSLPNLFLRWEQTIGRNFQNPCQCQKLIVGDAAELCLDLGKRATRNIEALQLTASGQFLLCQVEFAPPLADLR